MAASDTVSMGRKLQNLKQVYTQLASSRASQLLNMKLVEQQLFILPFSCIPNHPTYAAMILTAISELNEEEGSSEEAIARFIEFKYSDLSYAHRSLLRYHLSKLVEKNEIMFDSNERYLLPVENDVSSMEPKEFQSRSSNRPNEELHKKIDLPTVAKRHSKDEEGNPMSQSEELERNDLLDNEKNAEHEKVERQIEEMEEENDEPAAQVSGFNKETQEPRIVLDLGAWNSTHCGRFEGQSREQEKDLQVKVLEVGDQEFREPVQELDKTQVANVVVEHESEVPAEDNLENSEGYRDNGELHSEEQLKRAGLEQGWRVDLLAEGDMENEAGVRVTMEGNKLEMESEVNRWEDRLSEKQDQLQSAPDINAVEILVQEFKVMMEEHNRNEEEEEVDKIEILHKDRESQIQSHEIVARQVNEANFLAEKPTEMENALNVEEDQSVEKQNQSRDESHTNRVTEQIQDKEEQGVSEIEFLQEKIGKSTEEAGSEGEQKREEPEKQNLVEDQQFNDHEMQIQSKAMENGTTKKPNESTSQETSLCKEHIRLQEQQQKICQEVSALANMFDRITKNREGAKTGRNSSRDNYSSLPLSKEICLELFIKANKLAGDLGEIIYSFKPSDYKPPEPEMEIESTESPNKTVEDQNLKRRPEIETTALKDSYMNPKRTKYSVQQDNGSQQHDVPGEPQSVETRINPNESNSDWQREGQAQELKSNSKGFPASAEKSRQKRRGRPPKIKRILDISENRGALFDQSCDNNNEQAPKRGRGRPPKVKPEQHQRNSGTLETPKRVLCPTSSSKENKRKNTKKKRLWHAELQASFPMRMTRAKIAAMQDVSLSKSC